MRAVLKRGSSQFLLYAILKKCAPEFCKNRISGFTANDELKNYIRECRNYLETKSQMLTGPVSLRGNIRLNDAKDYDIKFERLIQTQKSTTTVNSLRIWLGDIPSFGGYSKAFDSSFDDTTITDEDIKSFVKAFIPLKDYKKVQLLIGAGYKGKNMGFADSYTRKRIFFGGGERWNVVFVDDQATINPIINKLIKDFRKHLVIDKIIEAYTNSADWDSFAYYLLTYPAALTSTGIIEKEPNYFNAYFYYAVEGDLNDMDIISIRSISGQPLSKAHIDLLVSAVLCEEKELFGHLKSLINYTYRQSENDGFSIKGIDDKSKIVPSKNGWYVKGNVKNLLQKHGIEIENDGIVSSLEGEDKVKVGQRIIKALARTLIPDTEKIRI